MPQNYTKMWDAFFGGEYEGADTSQGYLEQTQDFYSKVIGPAFGLDETFGSTTLAGSYAAFSDVDFEMAEREFRSAIGDPYGGTDEDPFSWEKVSRYSTEAGGYDRIQDLLEDQLYGQGKFLGGETGADYGTATAKGLEAYSSGLRGERESLTYEGLTGGAGLTSGTGGSVLRSGESASVAEDVLIEAYKKAKTLGSEYREGSEEIEQTLSEDLDTALTTYLKAIDDEKSRWFDSVMSNVNVFKTLEMAVGDTTEALTDTQLEEAMAESGGDFYNQWSCGYGQTWDATLNDGEGGCKDTTGEGGYEEEVAGYGFRDDPACGIGELWKDNGDGTGQCEVRDDTGLEQDDYGYLCQPGEIDCAGECGGSAVEDECGECGGDGSSCLELGCGPGEPGPSVECLGGTLECNESDCPPTSTLDDGEEYVNCSEVYGDAFEWDPVLQECVDMGTSGGWQWDTGSCHQPYNDCPSGECCCDNGICSANCCGGDDEYDPF